MNYEAWRISYQSSEQAAQAAFKQLSKLTVINDCLARENERQENYIQELRKKQFTRFAEDECWIWQGDGTDNLDTLVCPVVISAAELKALIEARDQLKAQYSELHAATTSLLSDYYIALDNVADDWDQDELLDAHQFAGHIDGILKHTPAQAMAEVQAQALIDGKEAFLDIKANLTLTAYDCADWFEGYANGLREQAQEAA